MKKVKIPYCGYNEPMIYYAQFHKTRGNTR